MKYSRSLSLEHCANIFQIGISTIESWMKLIVDTNELTDFPMDNVPGPSPILDDDQLEELNQFILDNAISIQSGWKYQGQALTASKIIEWIEEQFCKTVSHSYIRKILDRLNFQWLDSSVPDARASYNKIGHDRRDVVDYRQKYFLDKFISSYRCRDTIIVCQDESMFNCNMHSHRVYIKCTNKGQKWASPAQKRMAQKVRNRGQTYSLMIAGYMTKFGFINETLRTIKRGGIYGRQTYSSDLFLEDFEKAIDVCSSKFPGKRLVFLIDNAPSHKVTIPEITSESIPTWSCQGNHNFEFPYSSKEAYLKDVGAWKQQFEYELEPEKPKTLISQIKSQNMPREFRTLAEWRKHLKKQWADWHCWHRSHKARLKEINSIFLNSVTFKNFGTQIERIAQEKNVSVLFTPFYHAELNPIELIWGRMKQEMRMQQLSAIKSVSEAVPKILSSINDSDFCSKAFRRTICRIVNYSKYGYLKLSYYEYKNLVLQLSTREDPWSPESLQCDKSWLLQ